LAFVTDRSSRGHGHCTAESVHRLPCPRLDIILEAPGDASLRRVLDLLEADGCKVSVNYVHCPEGKARRRIEERAMHNPTPEDNL
jgi:hypothetical protein